MAEPTQGKTLDHQDLIPLCQPGCLPWAITVKLEKLRGGIIKVAWLPQKQFSKTFCSVLVFFKDFVSNMPYLHLIITTHQSKRDSHLSNNFYFYLSTQWIPQAFEK